MGPGSPGVFVGRHDERERIDALLGGVRNGEGSALLVAGEPGVGKSTLLDAAADAAAGMAVLRVTGYEVESAIPYGALQRLLGGLDGGLASLAPRHREALAVAFGDGDGAPPERSLVGLAVLNLLATASHPVLCLVDDAHLLDAESAEALGFVGRRLGAEPIGLLVASRPDEATLTTLAGLPGLPVEGLPESEAVELLRAVMPTALEHDVEASLVSDTGGNPLALVEVAREWEPHALTFASMTDGPGPIGTRLEQHYAALAGDLDRESWMWLLIAVTEATGDRDAVAAAAHALGLGDAAAEAVERAGLVTLRDVIRVRHPLVRSAVYGAATDADRRAAHAALSAHHAAAGDEERAARHAAAAAARPRRDIAERLVALADSAGERGAQVSRARLLVQAAHASPRPVDRAARLIAAAEAATSAGRARLALEIAADVDASVISAEGEARLLLVQARCSLFLSQLASATELIADVLHAADAVAETSPELERQLLLVAFELIQVALPERHLRAIASFGSRLREARALGDDALGLTLAAIAAFALADYEQAVPVLEAAANALTALADEDLIELTSLVVVPTFGLWDPDAALALLDRQANAARRRGALRELDASLWTASTVEIARGRPADAIGYLEQVTQVREALGYADQLAVNPAVLAWTGAPRETGTAVEEAVQAMGFGGVVRISRSAWASRQIADGDYEQAFATLVEVTELPFLQASLHHLPELVEAGVRSGHANEVAAAAAAVRAHAAACGRPWALAMSARVDALLAGDATAEPLYQDSIRHLDMTGLLGERGRARLLYGEWLRRRGRRLDASSQLSEAYHLLAEAGATVFVERARRELAAAGLVAPATPASSSTEVLTSQEAAVAVLAARGRTNAEIGERLFISANTVDYHLRKVFRKLGVTSRRQLADALDHASAQSSPSA